MTSELTTMKERYLKLISLLEQEKSTELTIPSLTKESKVDEMLNRYISEKNSLNNSLKELLQVQNFSGIGSTIKLENEELFNDMT